MPHATILIVSLVLFGAALIAVLVARPGIVSTRGGKILALYDPVFPAGPVRSDRRFPARWNTRRLQRSVYHVTPWKRTGKVSYLATLE
jgi:hypothetical protein